jgi:flagellar basal-body rod modification protein FlgD
MAVTSVPPVTGQTSSTAAGSAAAAATAGLGQDAFFKLLVTQMQNQDPLSPVSATDFVTQLAQFSQVSGMQTLNANVSQLLTLQQMSQGANLIGKQITYAVPGKTLPGSGVVNSLQVGNGAVNLVVGNQTVALNQVQTIKAATN